MSKERKTLLERMGLVERMDEPVYRDEYDEDMEEPVEKEGKIYADSTGVSSGSFIEDVYNESGLNNMEKSIYKVLEVSNNLPSTMPAEAKRTTVERMLLSFGISVSDVVSDASSRDEAISVMKDSKLHDLGGKVKALNAEIEELCAQVEEKRKEVQSLETDIDHIKDAAEAEQKKISELAEFIAGPTKES